MRYRRGLSPRIENAVAKLSEQDVDDLLVALPFLAPILPVPQAHVVGTGRTPRKGSYVSKGKLTPRSSILSARNSDAHQYGGHSTPAGGKTCAADDGKAARVAAKEYNLTVQEVELATKAWLQTMAGGQAPIEGSGSPSKTLQQSQSAAALFARACTTPSHVCSGAQLKDILQLLHVPVLSVIGDLLDAVVTLLGSAPAAASGVPVDTGRSVSLHFFKFLQFMCMCKHLDAIHRHRRFKARTQDGRSASVQPGEESPIAPDEEGEEEQDPPVELDLEDFEATFDHIAAQQGGATSPTSGEDTDAPAAIARHRYQQLSVSAKALEEFASGFFLSLQAVLPRSYLQESAPALPAGRARSPPPTGRRSSPTDEDSTLLRSMSSAAFFEASPKPVTRGAVSRAAPSPAPQTTASLHPNMSSAMVSLDEFVLHVNQLGSGGEADRTRSSMQSHSPDDTSIAVSPPAAAALRRPATETASALKLNLPTTAKKADLGLGGAQGVEEAGRAKSTTVSSPSNQQGERVLSLQPFATWAEKRSPLSTLQLPPLTYTSYVRSKVKKKEDEVERRITEFRLREEYLYGPPRPKPKKTSPAEESVRLLTSVSAFVEQGLPDSDIFAVDKISQKVRKMHVSKLRAEHQQTHRYAFMMPGGAAKAQSDAEQLSKPIVMVDDVRRATAQEILRMIQGSPDDSILGAQRDTRKEQRSRGLNGWSPTRAKTSLR